MPVSIRKVFTYNSSREYLARFAQRAADSLPVGARVLDAGAGDSPYKNIFTRARYESTDLCTVEKKYGRLSFISDIEKLPIRENCYDLVFCSQTLEHVTEPQLVIDELWRVLKPGGKLWLTAPFFFAEHEVPYDFFRYTQYGLLHLVQGSGFSIESIEWLEGYFGTLAYQLREATKALPVKPTDLGTGVLSWLLIIVVLFSKILFGALTPFFTWLDLRTKYMSKGQCKNYALIAVKLV
jgi:SAM-dependent methyltransferase